MNNNTAIFFSLVLKYVWMMLCFGTCAYAVFWIGYSGWWFLLAMALSASASTLQTDWDGIKTLKAKDPT